MPSDSEYVRNEIREMSDQLETERRLTGDAGAKVLFKEMTTIPANRKRTLISVILMICQQMTGVNSIVSAIIKSSRCGFGVEKRGEHNETLTVKL